MAVEIQGSTPRPVYAPLLGMVIHTHFDFHKIANIGDVKTCDLRFQVGAPEDGSKIEFLPVFVGKDTDQRYIHTKIKITYLDMEAQKYAPQISGLDAANYVYGGVNSNPGDSFSIMRKNVHADILCGSGAMTLINLKYAFYYEYIANRGMRFNHILTGKVVQPEWMTFLDDGWNAYVSDLQSRAGGHQYTDANLFPFTV